MRVAIDERRFPSLAEVAAICSGELRGLDETDRPIATVVIDSRAAMSGALFVALPGAHVDGHAFIVDAADRGAVAALVTEPVSEDGGAWPIPVVVVRDTLSALHVLAAWYVDEHLSAHTTRVGITGSNGKTTTKELARAALETVAATYASRGNYNSETGLPLAVFATPPGVPFAVFEMAMSNPGEMAPLAAIIRPHVAIITNIGTAHIGQLGSRDAIALEKKQIASRFTGQQTLIVPERDDYRSFLGRDIDGAVVDFGAESQRARIEVHTGFSEIHIGRRVLRVPLPGEHNARNALAVLRLLEVLGHPLQGRLAALAHAWDDMSLPAGRSEIHTHGALRIINDAYNANPDSMRAALAGVETDAVSVVILGDMLELGDFERDAHAEIVEVAMKTAARLVVLVGERFANAYELVSADRGDARADANADANTTSDAVATDETTGATSAADADTTATSTDTAAVTTAADGTARTRRAQGRHAAAGVHSSVRTFPTTDAAIAAVPELIHADDVVLLKGSRSMELERLVDAILCGEAQRA